MNSKAGPNIRITHDIDAAHFREGLSKCKKKFDLVIACPISIGDGGWGIYMEASGSNKITLQLEPTPQLDPLFFAAGASFATRLIFTQGTAEPHPLILKAYLARLSPVLAKYGMKLSKRRKL